MASNDNFVGGKRYPFGESMKMNRTIYEPPPPPPKPGDFPKKPPFWNLTGTSIQKEFNKGCVKVVLGLALFAGIIMYYGDSKMNRFYKHMTGSPRLTPDKVEMDHARRNLWLRNLSGLSIDNKEHDVALERMNRLQFGVQTNIDQAYHEGPLVWQPDQPEFGVRE